MYFLRVYLFFRSVPFRSRKLYNYTEEKKWIYRRHFWIDSPLSLGTSRIDMTSVLSVTITLNKIRLIRFTLWVFYLRTSKMKGTGLSGIYFHQVAFMVLVGTDTEHQEQHCSCLFLTKSTMGSSETFFFWRGSSELNGSGTANQTLHGPGTVLEQKKRIFNGLGKENPYFWPNFYFFR
jgi:hypothetical protein